jgi:hypothetical protein
MEGLKQQPQKLVEWYQTGIGDYEEQIVKSNKTLQNPEATVEQKKKAGANLQQAQSKLQTLLGSWSGIYKQYTGLDWKAPEQPEPYTLSPGQKRFDAAGNVVAEGGKKETPDRALKVWVTPDGKVTPLPNNVVPPEGSVPYSTGMEIESDGAGGFSLKTGVPRGGKGGVTKKTQGAIEEKQLATSVS